MGKEDKFRKMLDDEIEFRLNNLPLLEEGSEAKARATRDLDVLYRIKIEENDKAVSHRNSAVSTVTNVVTGLGSLVLGAFTIGKGFKFEETGTFTSQTFKQMFGNVMSGIKLKK